MIDDAFLTARDGGAVRIPKRETHAVVEATRDPVVDRSPSVAEHLGRCHPDMIDAVRGQLLTDLLDRGKRLGAAHDPQRTATVRLTKRGSSCARPARMVP